MKAEKLMIRTPQYWIEITRNALVLENYLPFIQDPGFGAFVIFGGTVRNFAEGKPVQALFYECYEPMAEKELERIAQECFAQWEVGRIVIVHRIGLLQLTEPSVYIIVASAHRADAFAAARFIIESIKQRVPIWKKEIFADNSSQWKHEIDLGKQ